tara:strand:- start:16329 stop:17858 length:1530 start_codon:yes stop_codon:yes gene_type:complete
MNILKAVGSFGSLTLLSRVLGYFRDILIAIFIGTSSLADAFFVAFRLPNTFRRLFAEGTFNAAFIPIYTKLSIKSRSENFTNSVFNFLLIILLTLTIIAEIFMGGFIFIISPGFASDPEKFKLATDLSRITFPFLLFVSISSFFSAILNSKGKFAVAAAAPIVLNIFLIFSIFYAKYFNQSFVKTMSLAVFFAGLVQMIILIFYCRKYFIPKINPIIKFTNPIKKFFTKLLPSIFSSGVMQINILVGTIIASFQSSAVSYLYYADRIYQLPLAISGIAIGTVVLPVLSKTILSETKEKVFFIQNRSIELSVFLSAPAAVGIIVGSEEIISCLFGYGSFSEISVLNTAKALVIFGFGLPAFSLLKLYSNFYFARGDTKFPFKISVFTVLSNIFISIIFFKKYGFLSIAAGTTVSCWLAALVYKYKLKIDNFHNSDSIFIERSAKIFVCSLIMGSLLYYQFFYFQDYFKERDLVKVLYLFFIVGNSIIVYFIMSVMFKAFSIKDFKLKNYK